MKNFNQIIRQIDISIDNVLIYEIILNTIIIFLFVSLILGLFNIDVLYSLVPSLTYFSIALVYVIFRINKRKLVEGKYEPLNEKLRTAADNIKLENPVVEELQKEVLDELKNVRVSSFLHERKSSFKLVISILLCIAILSMSMVDARIVGLNLYVNNNPVFFQNKTIMIVNNKVILADLNQSDDIYGEEDIAKLGDVELGIRVKPADFEVDVSEEGEIENKRFDETFPSEVFVESGTAYEENIPVDKQELVKNYFKKIAVS